MCFLIYLFVGLPFSLSVSLFVYMSVSLSICLPDSVYLSIYLSEFFATLLGMTSEGRMFDLLVIIINRGELFSVGLFIIRSNQFVLIILIYLALDFVKSSSKSPKIISGSFF